MLDTKLDIENITTKLSKHNMWKILTKNLSIKDFVIPNPAISLQLGTHKETSIGSGETFRFLFTNKINTRKQTLTEWIKYNPAPKPIESVDDWEDYIHALENSAGLEEDNPF